MNHYECAIVIGKRRSEYDSWTHVRRCLPVLVDARSWKEAREYMRQHHTPDNLLPGEAVSHIKAKKVTTAYVMEKLNQERLL